MRHDMPKRASIFLLSAFSAIAFTVASAQETQIVVNGAPTQTIATAPAKPAYTQQQLDELLAPIALYPDALLSQILMAATYPLEVVEAARWSKANLSLQGDAAVQAVVNRDWDPSVKSLVAFPQVLATLDDKLDWTEQLGEAFLAQQADVMSTVQSLRAKAYAAGNLQSSSQQQVTQNGQTIIIAPYSPDTVYVPYYDPRVVYGVWWWPTPPVYWAPFPTYYAPVSSGVVWGAGISVSLGFFFGAVDWTNRHVTVVHTNNYYYHPPARRDVGAARPTALAGAPQMWRHDETHRLEYHNETVRRQYAPPMPAMRASPSASPAMRSNPQGGSSGSQTMRSAPTGNNGVHAPGHASQPQGGGGDRHSGGGFGGGGDRH